METAWEPSIHAPISTFYWFSFYILITTLILGPNGYQHLLKTILIFESLQHSFSLFWTPKEHKIWKTSEKIKKWLKTTKKVFWPAFQECCSLKLVAGRNTQQWQSFECPRIEWLRCLCLKYKCWPKQDTFWKYVNKSENESYPQILGMRAVTLFQSDKVPNILQHFLVRSRVEELFEVSLVELKQKKIKIYKNAYF